MDEFKAPDDILLNPNFKKWFGSSITTENFKPVVFYHISKCPDKLTEFKPPVYFTEARNKQQAQYIGFLGGEGDKRHEYYCYLNIEVPYYFYDNRDGLFDNQHYKISIIDITPELIAHLKDIGYDAIIIQRVNYFSEYILFSNNQIKSIYNNGEFSNDNDILK